MICEISNVNDIIKELFACEDVYTFLAVQNFAGIDDIVLSIGDDTWCIWHHGAKTLLYNEGLWRLWSKAVSDRAWYKAQTFIWDDVAHRLYMKFD